MSSTSFYTSSSVKIMKSIADVGKRCSSFRARVRCNAQFATVSSCARRFLKHFNFEFWRTTRCTEEWWISVSREIWRVSVTFWCTFLTQNQFIDRINVIISARTATSSASLTPYRTTSFTQFCLQLIKIRNRPTFLRKFPNQFLAP